jgi:four helix bundle protein
VKDTKVEVARKKLSKFGYEDLEVWNKAVDFAVKVIDVVEDAFDKRKHYRLLEQIEACSTSVAMNLAEGKGRYSKKEFIQYLYISRGSLYETMTLLEILRRKKWISDDTFEGIESHGKEIVAMIKGLINAIKKNL